MNKHLEGAMDVDEQDNSSLKLQPDDVTLGLYQEAMLFVKLLDNPNDKDSSVRLYEINDKIEAHNTQKNQMDEGTAATLAIRDSELLHIAHDGIEARKALQIDPENQSLRERLEKTNEALSQFLAKWSYLTTGFSMYFPSQLQKPHQKPHLLSRKELSRQWQAMHPRYPPAWK
jgi:hypothetical protein